MILLPIKEMESMEENACFFFFFWLVLLNYIAMHVQVIAKTSLAQIQG